MPTEPARSRPETTFRFEGRARCLGDHVNTDYIIYSARKRETLDPHVLKQWLLEGVDPALAASVEPGDILVAGEAFGCGSAMEVAVTVVQAAGIPAVLARSFARSYFRNAVNNGLLPVECDTSGIAEGDRLVIDVAPSGVMVRIRGAGQRSDPGRRVAGDAGVVKTSSRSVAAPSFAPFILDILTAGGLAPYLRERGGFGNSNPDGAATP